MSEMRRIELSSVKSSEKEPKVKRKVKTIRVVLALGESNVTSCPEYSFADLIKAANDRNGETFDPFEVDEEKEVAAIAQRFEAKYGAKSFKSGKKRQTQDMDDYCDVGDGYDEDDPFIDNTEAYDEVVPSTMTTKYGGFYVNQGKLDFKSISDDSNDSIVAVDKTKKKNKRKIIESDSDEETPEAIAKKFKAMKRKKLLEGREAEKKKKKLGGSFNGDVSIMKKKKKKNLLKLKQSSRDSLLVKDVNSTTPKQTPGDTPVVVTTPVTTSPTSATTQSTVSSLNGNNVTPSPKEDKSGGPEDIVMKDSGNVVINVDESSSKSGDEEKKPESTSEEKNTQLPSALPPKLAEDIAKIKQLAKMSTEGKSKFFSGNTSKLLLTIENESLKLSKSHRSAIFNHLAEYLPSGKNALLRRAKKLRQAQFEDPMKGPMEKLREAVKLAMPKAIENHQIIIAKAKLEAKPNGTDTPTEEAATESDEDENKATDTKKTRMPRRKFSWSPEIIELFLKVVEVKMNVYSSLKNKSQPPDEYLKAFLEAEVKPIWPNNWMNTRALLKLHREETAKRGKSKKNVSGKVSPVPTSDPLNSNPQPVSKMDSILEISNKKAGGIEEIKRSNTSITDDIIEISSIIDDDDVEEKKNVVVNLPDTDAKSTLSINLPPAQTRPSVPSSICPTVPCTSSNIPTGQIRPESKAVPNKSSSSSGNGNDHLYNTVKKLPDKTGAGSTSSLPIVVAESPKTPTPLRQGTIISNPVPKAASTPILTGSNVSSTAHLNNRSFLQALDPPTLQKEGPLPSKPHVSLLSPQQQYKPASSNNVLNTVLHAYQPQQKQQQQQKKLQLPSSQIRNNSNNVQPSTKTGSSLSLQQQQQQQKIRPSKDSKLTIMHQKNTPYPVLVSTSNKDPLHSPVTSTSIPPAAMVASKQFSTISVTKGGNSSASPQAALLGNRLSMANQQRQPESNNHPPFNLSAQQQQKQKQFQGARPIQSQATVVSPPYSQSQQPNRKFSSSVANASANSNSNNNSSSSLSIGGMPKQSPSRQQQKSPSSQSSSNYLPSKNNQFLLNNKSSPVNVLQSSMLPAGSQIKSGIVLGTSLPKFKPQNNSNTDRNTNSTTKPLSIQTSMLSSSSISPSSIFSVSRTSTPSPQKSPGSPGTTAASLYDQIQSQILNQEATQEQGLKVLAMAMNIEGKPKLGQGSNQGTSAPGKYK